MTLCPRVQIFFLPTLKHANYGTVGIVCHSGHCSLVGILQHHRMTYSWLIMAQWAYYPTVGATA